MIAALSIAAGAIVFSGVVLATSRDLLRVVVGISLLGYAANLVVFVAGRPEPGRGAPIVGADAAELASAAADPVPQALVLTAIVIGFALTCFSLLLALSIGQRTGHADGDLLREVEPPPNEDGSPALAEDDA